MNRKLLRVLYAVLIAGILCTSLWAQTAAPKAQIRTENGMPRLYYGDEPVPMFLYRNRIHDDAAYMKQFADAGVRLFVMTHLVDWNKTWDEHFAEVRRRLDMILDFNDRTLVVLGFFAACSPQWAKDNPDELQWQDGKPLGPMAGGSALTAQYSLASLKFEAEAVGMVKRYVEFLKTYPRRDRVIGLFFEGGNAQEWFDFKGGKRFYDHPDTGPAMLRAYRDYARSVYKTNEALALAYQQPGLTFDTLSFPNADLSITPDVGDFFDPHKGTSRAIHDFWKTQATQIADRVIAMGKAAKELDPSLLCGIFHEPLMDDGKTSYEVARVFDTPYLDFFAGPPAYDMRNLRDHLPIHTVIDSLNARNKFFIVEEDLRPYGTGRGLAPPHSDKIVQDTITTYQRDLLHDMTKGTMGWAWDFQFQWFGHEQRYFDAFQQLQRIGMLNIQAKSKPVAEIAVLVDENSKYFTRGDNRLHRNLDHREIMAELGSLGAPYDIWLQQDAARPDFPLDRYKLILVFDCYRLNDADRKGLDRLKSNKRTILWLHGSGFINDDRTPALSVKNMTELTGINFGRYDQRAATTVIVPDTRNKLTALLPLGYTFGQFYRMTSNGRAFPPVTRIAPIFAVEDKQSVPAGWYAMEDIGQPAETSTGQIAPPTGDGNAYYVGMAYKEFPEWTSVYAGVVAAPSEFLRAMAKFAGVHLYLDTDDIIYANSNMIVLLPRDRAGTRTIHLPKPSRVYDLLNDLRPIAAEPVSEFTVDVQPLRTNAWWLSDQPPVLPQVK